MKFLMVKGDGEKKYLTIGQLFEMADLVGQQNCENLARGNVARLDFQWGYIWCIAS